MKDFNLNKILKKTNGRIVNLPSGKVLTNNGGKLWIYDPDDKSSSIINNLSKLQKAISPEA